MQPRRKTVGNRFVIPLDIARGVMQPADCVTRRVSLLWGSRMMKWSDKNTVSFVLLLHTILLGWSAARHSPVVDEVGHMPSGLSHWKLQRFDLYNVNPPLVRTVATLPLHLLDVPINFDGYQILPKHRSEFMIGSGWITSHPDSFRWNFTISRWACIPFSLLGAVTCFLWARELFGARSGLCALCLWCFCPNILAHGS